MCPPTRRAVLAGGSTLAGSALAGSALAGCTGVDRTGNSTSNEPSGESVSLEVDAVIYRTTFFYKAYIDAPGIAASAGDQFVFAALEDGPEVSPNAFELEVDDRRFSPTEQPGGVSMDDLAGMDWTPDDWPLRAHGEGRDRTLAYEDGYGLLAFVVPRDVGPVTSVELVVDTDEGSDRWALAEAKAASLGGPPDFDASLSLPDEIVWERRFTAEITARNDGDRRGRFAALFGLDDPDHPRTVTAQVEPGEDTTTTVEARYPPLVHEPDIREPPAEVAFDLDTGVEVVRASTEVVEE